eukprot:TRINITY_DN21907_c0_g1_i1.p1 TRINITY_DN21907_c0_g1~~TRINITY_DN21907_c0_g1_i1.p1  ORF type:complete len:817 (+),score=105.89 TRINITY_DN21907_c0_g1_i1:100-2550(+)
MSTAGRRRQRVVCACCTLSLATLALLAVDVFPHNDDLDIPGGLAPADAAAAELSAPLPPPPAARPSRPPRRPKAATTAAAAASGSAARRVAGGARGGGLSAADPAARRAAKGTQHAADPPSERATLSCSTDPPGVPDPPELAYWRSVPSDDHYVSEYRDRGPADKYVLFEPDAGGWNNVRMALETVIVFALLTGRTLVMPQRKMIIYLLDKNPSFSRNAKGVQQMYRMDHIASRLPVITFEDFYAREVRSGGIGPLPPRASNEEVWLNGRMHGKMPFYDWLRERGPTGPKNLSWPAWDVSSTVLVFPPAAGGSWEEARDHDEWFAARLKYIRSLGSGHRRVVQYTSDLQNTKVVHFSGDTVGRTLTHFYTWIVHADRARDDFAKRFVRDWLHYDPELFCKARDLLSLLMLEGEFSSMHVRRGELQFEEVKLEASKLLQQTRGHLKSGETIYISTDEKDINFFRPFVDAGYKVRTLRDYYERAGLGKINQNWMGMIESIVASQGRTFTGTYMSTFTAYIYRLRLYYGKALGTNWYHSPGHERDMQDPEAPMERYPSFSREWAVCCLGIDSTTVPHSDGAWAATHRLPQGAADGAARGPGGSITIYADVDCIGDSLEVASGNSERLCSNCWDACGKKFNRGAVTSNEYGGQVRSLRVSGALNVTVAGKNCHGMYEYSKKEFEEDYIRQATAADGCVSFQGLRAAHLRWTRTEGGAVLYSNTGCTGGKLLVNLDSEERRCSGCADSCGNVFDDGQPSHGSASNVRSLRVQGTSVLLAWSDGCHGSFPYGQKKESKAERFTAAHGCRDVGGLVHFMLARP